MDKQLTPTQMVAEFKNYSSQLIEDTFPEKIVTISDYDKPYITEKLKYLRRQRQRLYRKHGKCTKYLALKKLFIEKLRQEAEKYRLKIINEVNEGKRNNLYSALRKLEPGYEDKKQSTFTLPSHVEQNLSPAQSAEAFADFFSSISQQFEPISIQKFPPSLKQKLECGRN